MAKHSLPNEKAVPDIKHLWLDDIEDHDYDAAFNFLRIKVGKKRAEALVDKLRGAKLIEMRANDILRATDLRALDVNDPGTHHNMVKTIMGKSLSPVLIVSLQGGNSTIADGYHRVSWVYWISPWAMVPGKLIVED